MINYGELHPITIHFPVVLITIATIIDFTSYFTQSKTIYRIASCFVIATWLFMIPALATGFLAAQRFSPDNSDVFLHKNVALMAFFAITLNSIIRIFYFFKFPALQMKYAIFFNGLTFFLIIITGDIGGYITHGPLVHARENAKATSYYSLNPTHARSYKPEEMKAFLASKIDLSDVQVIFKKNKCNSCHSDFFADDKPNFSISPKGQRPWLPRDKDDRPLDWENSPFYKTVIQLNRMPYDETKSPIGLSWSERLVLLDWMLNGAPQIETPIPTDEEPEDSEK